MDRDAMQSLIKWKSSSSRKPLILNGARQVGKTWLLKDFGQKHFNNVAYINFDSDPTIRTLFDSGYDIKQLLTGIQAATGETINPNNTLIIFDEIQECPKALTSLKYFCENRPDLHIVSAGSLLGLTIHHGTGFPVGKVDLLNLYPLNFQEFLDAIGQHPLREILDSADAAMIETFSAKLKSLLKQYYFVGGMPEAVMAYISDEHLGDARVIQNQILFGYRMDISKHLPPQEVERVLAVWDSIPRHLGKENKKFIFSAIKKGARGRDYKTAISWLSQAGLAYTIQRISKPSMPLSAYADQDAFKLFLVDIGLLGALSNLEERSVIGEDAIFEEFKGSLTEQYVCQELISSCNLTPYYWTASNSTGEIDFLVQDGKSTYPIEVKAAENLRAKSLRAFFEKFPNTHPLRFSMSGYRQEAWMTNVPLFAIMERTLWD